MQYILIMYYYYILMCTINDSIGIDVKSVFYVFYFKIKKLLK